jgi:CRP/FNR family cyclic AMP-dependent transcriptional regulator
MPGDIFKKLNFFEGLSDVQLELLRPIFELCDCPPGMKIFVQGAPATYLYIVVAGEVLVEFKPYDSPPIVIARVKPGGMFGWSAALGNRDYTSGAVSTTYTQVLRVQGDDLRNACEKRQDLSDIILRRLADVIAQRHNVHPQVMAILETGLRNGKSGGK